MHTNRRGKDALRRIIPKAAISYYLRRVRPITTISIASLRKCRFKLDRNSPVVTILGSCRQDSLYKIFEVTAIREGLTYPHYANEVLQLIRYCTKRVESNFVSPYVFRNDCIGKKRLAHKKAYKEFKRTDIFVIEISSLLEYVHHGEFIHHEAYDRPHLLDSIGQSSIELDHQDIIVKKQNLLEMDAVLSEIVKEIGGNKIVFVSNLSSRSAGSRFELNAHLREFSVRNGCAYFDPSDLLLHYSLEEICKNEPVISHFTEFGHELVGIRLSRIIRSVYLQNFKSKKYLIQKYRAIPRSTDIHGLGDFLYGCLKIFEVAKKRNLVPAVDFSMHPMANFLKNSSYNLGEATTIFHTQSDKPLQSGGVFFTNQRPQRRPSKEALDFLLSEVLTPNASFNATLKLRMKTLNFEKNRYVVFHVRVGDESLYEGKNDSKSIMNIVSFISKAISTYQNDYSCLVISDSKVLVDALTISGIRTGSISSTHFGDSRGSKESIQETLVDFFLLLGARKVIQISNYSWGSGFSDIPCMLFEIPIERHQISEIWKDSRSGITGLKGRKWRRMRDLNPR